MNKQFGAAILAAATAATAATAQEFKGAEISGEILAYTEDSDFGETAYRGSVEFGLLGGFGVQADLAFHNSRTIDLGSRAFTIHALYDAYEFATAGLFYTRDELDLEGMEGSVDIYGLEAGSSFGAAGAEGFLAIAEGGGAEYRLFGVDAAYDVNGSVSVIGSAAFLSGDSDASRLSAGGSYRFGDGPSVYAEIGRLSVDDGTGEDSATFVTLSARLAIGPNQGTTFGSRGLFDVLTGF